MEASKHLKNYSTTIKFSNFVIHRGKHSGHYGMKTTYIKCCLDFPADVIVSGFSCLGHPILNVCICLKPL